MIRARSELVRPDVEALLSTCGKGKAAARDRALILFLRMTGCRVSEALSVRQSNIDRGARRIVIPGTKTRASMRAVPLPAALLLELDRWLEIRSRYVKHDAPVFCAVRQGNEGAELDRKKVDRMLKRRAAKAGMGKRVHAHAFRHGLAADLVRSGAPSAAIMAQLGHADLRVTTRYIGQLAADEAAASAIENLFSRGEEVTP